MRGVWRRERADHRPDALGKIKAAKAINVAYLADSLPFSFTAPNGEPGRLLGRPAQGQQIGRAVGEPNLKVNCCPAP